MNSVNVTPVAHVFWLHVGAPKLPQLLAGRVCVASRHSDFLAAVPFARSGADVIRQVLQRKTTNSIDQSRRMNT